MNKELLDKYYGGNPIDNFANGKLTRMQFIVSSLSLMVAMGVLLFLLSSLLGIKGSSIYALTGSFKSIILVAIFAIVYYAFLFSFVTKRLRDMAQNPWWSLVLLVPYINLVLALFLIFVPSRNKTVEDTIFESPE